VISYMENENLPFEHADIWVPSFLGTDKRSDGNFRLFHAGHATRCDLESTMAYRMNEYGVYSTNFSFAPGVGLPGRVYASGMPSWEGGVDDADPTYFERAGGAKVYGVRCALGIPLHTASIGRIVLAMYSTTNVPENKQLTSKFLADFTKWMPEPKWKLVIDLGPASSTTSPVGGKGTQSPVSDDENLSRVIGKATVTRKRQDNKMKDEEERITGLLGDHIPLANTHDSAVLLPHFMSLRLLLLRSPGRRSPEECEMLEIVKKSFRGFSKDNRRSGAELAKLLAKDWMYLSVSLQSNAKASEQHKCHVMQAPVMQTTSNGTPTTMPATLVSSPVAQPVQVSHQQIMPLNALNSVDPSAKMIHHHHSLEDHNTVPMHHTSANQSTMDHQQMHVVPES